MTRMEHLEARTLWNTGPPRLRYEEATIDVALKAATEFDAIAVLASAVQGRRTTAERLLGVVAARERVARRAFLVSVLTDIAEGTCSVLERVYLQRVERAHGLPRAARQVPGVASSKRVYRDAEYEGLIIELDGCPGGRCSTGLARRRGRWPLCSPSEAGPGRRPRVALHATYAVDWCSIVAPINRIDGCRG